MCGRVGMKFETSVLCVIVWRYTLGLKVWWYVVFVGSQQG